MTDLCVIRVGHPPTEAVWCDARNPTFVVCDRHRRQYDERTDDLGPFDWVCMLCNDTGVTFVVIQHIGPDGSPEMREGACPNGCGLPWPGANVDLADLT